MVELVAIDGHQHQDQRFGKHRAPLCKTLLFHNIYSQDRGFDTGWRGNRNRGNPGGQVHYFQAILDPAKYYYYPTGPTTIRAAYQNRHRPQFTAEYRPDGVKGCYKYLQKYLSHPTPMGRGEYCDSMPTPSKRVHYHAALSEIDRLGRYKSIITPFTKIEKMKTGKYKAPRMIQARHTTFNIEYGRYIKPLESFTTKKHKLNYHFGKGDYNDVARRILTLSRKYSHYTEGDHSEFDAHVTKEHLRVTHKFYQRCYKNDPAIMKLSRRTLNNRCISPYGDKYSVRGTRMSGDVDTSFGNSLINQFILQYLLDELKLKGEAIVNGDDFILFTNGPVDIELAKSILLTMNMECKFIPSKTSIHEVEFCRAKLIYSNNGMATMMIDPERILSIYGMTYHEIPDYIEYLRQVMVAIYSINRSNVVGSLARKYYKTIPFPKSKYRNSTLLTRQLHRIIDREADAFIDQSTEINIFHITAYPYILKYENKLKIIAKTIRNWLEHYRSIISYQHLRQSRDYNVLISINHSAKTMASCHLTYNDNALEYPRVSRKTRV